MNIVLYDTRDLGYGFDEDLPAILAQECFDIEIMDRQTDGQLTPEILGNYDQLWFVSTEPDAILGSSEVEAIMAFHDQGKGIARQPLVKRHEIRHLLAA